MVEGKATDVHFFDICICERVVREFLQSFEARGFIKPSFIDLVSVNTLIGLVSVNTLIGLVSVNTLIGLDVDLRSIDLRSIKLRSSIHVEDCAGTGRGGKDGGVTPARRPHRNGVGLQRDRNGTWRERRGRERRDARARVGGGEGRGRGRPVASTCAGKWRGRQDHRRQSASIGTIHVSISITVHSSIQLLVHTVTHTHKPHTTLTERRV